MNLMPQRKTHTNQSTSAFGENIKAGGNVYCRISTCDITYKASNAKSVRATIVTAYLKVKASNAIPVLLKQNEAYILLDALSCCYLSTKSVTMDMLLTLWPESTELVSIHMQHRVLSWTTQFINLFLIGED